MTEVGVWSGDIVDIKGVTFRGNARDVVAPEMYEDETYPLLSGIDPYGDTVFNSLQLPRLIKELERRFEAMESGLSRQRVGKVLGVARECQDAPPHTYLVFVGD
jgi:hypothetical protein